MAKFFIEQGINVDSKRMQEESKRLDEVKSGETVHYKTTSWRQESSNDDLANDYYGPPHPGFTIRTDTIQFVVEWSQGDEGDQWSKNLISYGPVGYHVITIHHRFGTSGKVAFHFEYDITRN